MLCFAGAVGAEEKKDDIYIVEERGRSTWRMTFDKKYPTSAEQWGYARKTQNKGWLKKADRRMLYLVRRWPNSQEAPWAQRARADMLYSRGKLKDAFKEYQYLISNYSSRMRDYDSVLECQFEIAVDIMNRKRMRWLFGGYRAPEYSGDYFEDVIRNGPQWLKAQEAQFLIGQAYQEAKEYELAVSAYGVLGYRYPESSFSEAAALQQIECLNKLRLEYPSSLDILERQLTATTVFKDRFPASTQSDKITQLRNELYEVMAQKVYDEAAFYAKVPKKPKSAIIYYERLINEFPKSKVVPEAHARIAELETLLQHPVIAAAQMESQKEKAEKGVNDAVE